MSAAAAGGGGAPGHPPADLVELTVDGRSVRVPRGTLLVEAVKAAGRWVPTFCYHPKLTPVGVCRMCLVEVQGVRKPVTACTTPVSPGMAVATDSPSVQAAQKGVLEFLLLNHPLDCPVCDKGGECDLQDLTYAWGPATSRLTDGKIRKRKAVDLGPFILLDEERCILCRRCTRFADEVAQERDLILNERGGRTRVATASGEAYRSYFGGNTIDLCPVGALTSRLYRFRARPWDLTRVPSVCTACSVGCNIRLDYRLGHLVRVVPREHPAVDGGWICDRGRFNYQYVESPARLTQPLRRVGEGFVAVSWGEALTLLGRQLAAAVAAGAAKRVGAVGGGRLTLEEAYLFARLMKGVVGTDNVDWRPGRQRVASLGDWPARLEDLDRADAILLVDVLPAEVAPVLDLRVRRAAARGRARVVSVGPAVPAYTFPFRAVGVVPGETAPGLARPEVRETLAGAERLVVVWDGTHPEVGRALIELLAAHPARHKGVLIPGEQANARGAELAGLRPGLLPGFRRLDEPGERSAVAHLWQARLPEEPGRDTAGILAAAAAGEIGFLYLVGVNLLNTFPARELVREALEGPAFVVVQDLFLTETARRADLVLPAAPWTARRGHYVNLEGRLQGIPQVAHSAGGEARTDGAIFAAVAQALGQSLPAGEGEVLAELARLLGCPLEADSLLPGGPASLQLPPGPAGRAAGSAAPEAAGGGREPVPEPGGLWLVTVPRLHAGGGTAWFDEPFRAGRPAPEAAFHPADAARLGIRPGQQVALRGPAGHVLVLPAAVRAGVVAGTVQVIGGLPEAPAGLLAGSGGRVRLQVEQPVLQGVG